MQPFNYNVNVGNPQESFLRGMQQSFSLQDRDRAMQNAEAQQQAQRQAQEQQIQMQQELNALSQKPNPTAQDYARVATRYPQLAANLKNVWEPLGAEQRQNKISLYTQVLSALKSGNPDIAADLVKKQAEAYRNSGDEQQASSSEALSKVITINPKAALDSAALSLSQAMGPDQFAKVYDSLSKTPIEAENLSTKLQLENQKSVEDIQNSQLKRKLDVIDSQIKRADSDAKRDELQLKRDEIASKLTETDATKQAQAQGQLDAVNQQLGTIDKILNSPMVKGGMGDVGSVFRPGLAAIPGTDARDFENLVDTVKSQQFLSNLAAMKSSGGTLGQVTEKEGERMEKALASLDTNQSSDAFKAAVTTIKRSLERIQQQVIASGKLPTEKKGAGATVVETNTPFGVVTDSMINKVLRSTPGATREQVIRYLSTQKNTAAGAN